jgi:hypothetical protein
MRSSDPDPTYGADELRAFAGKAANARPAAAPIAIACRIEIMFPP